MKATLVIAALLAHSSHSRSSDRLTTSASVQRPAMPARPAWSRSKLLLRVAKEFGIEGL